jgi:proprotein convertase subtilisin/kexin type 5
MKTLICLILINMFLISSVSGCVDECQTNCSLNPTATEECSSCDNTGGYYSLDGVSDPMRCYTQATKPQTTYIDTTANTIKSCKTDGKCASCSNGTSCDTCISGGYYLNSDGDKLCYAKTSPPNGFYFDTTNNKFAACNVNCASCTEAETATSNKCISCVTNKYLLSGTQNCYADGDTHTDGYFLNNNVWTKCFDGCKSCSAAGTKDDPKCTNNTCLANYIWFTDANSKNFCLKSTNPPVGYFYSQADAGFKACGTNCATCNQAANGNNQNCLTCNDPTNIKLFTNEGNNNCEKINAPPTNYSWSATNIRWEYSSCVSSCSTCSKAGIATDHNCYTCAANYYPVTDKLTNCFKDTNAGYYIDFTVYQWKKCDSSCATCRNGSSCETCAQGKFLDTANKLCITDCPTGYYKDAGTGRCKMCVFPCSACDGPSSCLNCQNGYTLSGKSCYTSNCPSTNQFKDSLGNCQTCSDSCKTCSTSVACDQCVDGTMKFEKNCVKTCPNNYYVLTNADGTKQCNQCDSSCQTCSDSTKNCLTCIPGLYKSGGACVPQCPTNQTLDKNGVCKSCSELGTSLLNNSCVPTCPEGYASVNGICKTCKDANQLILGGNCVPTCPDGYDRTETGTCFYKNDQPKDYNKLYKDNTPVYDCDPQPCINDGTCKTVINNDQAIYYCECPTSFYGGRCQYNIATGNYII